MASTLLSSSRFFLPSQSQNRDLGVIKWGFHSSFYGKMIPCSRSTSIVSRGAINGRLGGFTVVASVLGREAKKLETVIPDPDYRIPIVLLGLAGGLVYADKLYTAVPTTRVRFVFDQEALEVRIGDELKESGENAFVGGKNRWKFSTFVNWELWWPNFPILVYFKETQTKPEGQIHFFPVIFNGKQLYDVMVERAGPSKNSGPKPS
ncbi:Protein of unknown function DUF3119 [Dillenia turbinata]|uniref:Uncharacterized protein n=1 Tax=Dillenia turbinata TaxID=194707 RepID=A0AAN8WFN3_9MAGN